MPDKTIVLVGWTQSATDAAQGLRHFGYTVLQPATPAASIPLIISRKPQLVICEEPCLVADNCTLFDTVKNYLASGHTQYLSLTTLAAATADHAWEKTEDVGVMIKPVYLEQILMHVRWLIGAPDESAAVAD